MNRIHSQFEWNGRARAVLPAATPADLSNAAFGWLTAQQIAVAGCAVLALRISYAGELGWELHMPRAAALPVYDALWAAGESHGIADYASFAVNALRMEKDFPEAGELTNEVTLPEAGVMRFVKLDKDFLGKVATQASLAAMEAGRSPWVCAYLSIGDDGEVEGHGGEAVLQAGDVAGSTASIAYAHTIGRIFAFAYVTCEAAAPGNALEVVIHGRPRPATVLAEAAYDPKSLKPRSDAPAVAAQ